MGTGGRWRSGGSWQAWEWEGLLSLPLMLKPLDCDGDHCDDDDNGGGDDDPYREEERRTGLFHWDNFHLGSNQQFSSGFEELCNI